MTDNRHDGRQSRPSISEQHRASSAPESGLGMAAEGPLDMETALITIRDIGRTWLPDGIIGWLEPNQPRQMADALFLIGLATLCGDLATQMGEDPELEVLVETTKRQLKQPLRLLAKLSPSQRIRIFRRLMRERNKKRNPVQAPPEVVPSRTDDKGWDWFRK